MKKYILLSLVSFLCIILYAQPKDSVKLPHPFALLSPQQQKEVLFIKSLSDYSYIEGRQFGTFCATDTTGKIILTNDNLMGKLVFINFWFDGCAIYMHCQLCALRARVDGINLLLHLHLPHFPLKLLPGFCLLYPFL